MKTFELKEVVTKISEEVRGKATIEDFEAFETKMVPRMEASGKLVLRYKEDNEKMLDCVAGFDNLLCQKANKH